MSTKRSIAPEKQPRTESVMAVRFQASAIVLDPVCYVVPSRRGASLIRGLVLE